MLRALLGLASVIAAVGYTYSAGVRAHADHARASAYVMDAETDALLAEWSRPEKDDSATLH